MKKFVVLVLSLALSFVFTACAQDEVGVSNEVSSVDVVAEAKEKLKEAYELCGHAELTQYYSEEHKHIKLSADGLTLNVDSNPFDTSAGNMPEVVTFILEINNHLGLPSSVSTKMKATRAMDGMQSQDCGKFTVTWTYHPDGGLEVIYEVNQ